MPEKKNVAPVQPEETTAKKPVEKKEKTTVIYLGPVIAGVVVPGTVYNNGLPGMLEKETEKCPALQKLLVDVRSAGQMRKKLKNPQSAAGICYQKALDYVKKRGVKG